MAFLRDGVPFLISEPHENHYEVGVDLSCPFSWNSVEGQCLKLMEHERQTWHEAEITCQVRQTPPRPRLPPAVFAHSLPTLFFVARTTEAIW